MLALFLMTIDTPEDRSKFENLYKQYEKLLLTIAFDILRDYHLAEDAVNDAFIKIIENLDKVEEIDSPQTKRFVVIITKNTCLDALRKRTRTMERIIDVNESQNGLEDVGAAPGAHDEFFQQFEIQKLKSAFKSLGLDHQIVLYYHAVLGESISRVAEMLDIKPETAKKRIYRARQSLRKIVEDDYEQ